MFYKRGKPDGSQKEILDAAIKAGCSVINTTVVGRGFVDAVIGHHGQTYLVEIKTGKGKLRDNQVKFQDDWRGGAIIEARTPEELLKKLGVIL